MQKTKSRVVEQILSVLLSVGVISTFSTYVQASNADEQKVKTAMKEWRRTYVEDLSFEQRTWKREHVSEI